MSAPTAEVPTLELHFHRPPFWSGPTLTILTLLGSLLLGLAFGLGLLDPSASDLTHAGRIQLFLVMAALVGVAVAVLAWCRKKTRVERVTPVRAYSTHLEVPRRVGSSRTQRIDYAELLSLGVVGKDRRATLFLSTARQRFVYRLPAFVDSDAFERLGAEVYQRLLEQPEGERLLAQMAERDALGRAAGATRPTVTIVLLVLLGLCFAATALGGAQHTPFGLVRFGANAPALINAGQWFRLFSANFLHANLLHIYMNGMGLMVLGSQLERLLGPWRLSLIYLLSALGGSIASAVAARAAFSVGASTAIFGLLGALAVVNWRFRRELPAGFRQPLRWWVFILGLNAALPLLVGQIDVAAHVGGFFAGALVTQCAIVDLVSIQRGRETRLPVKLVASLVIALFGAALAQAVAHARHAHPEDERRVLESLAGK